MIIQAHFNRAINCIPARIVIRLMFRVSNSTHHSYNILFNILCTLILYHPERGSTPIMIFSESYTKSRTGHYFSISDFECIIRLIILSVFLITCCCMPCETYGRNGMTQKFKIFSVNINTLNTRIRVKL